DIEGHLPEDIKGTLYKCGAANFQRGGKQYEHLFDGDGFVSAFHFGDNGVQYTSNFVETEYFKAEQQRDEIVYRSFFGTQPEGKSTDNTLKNPANTNAVEWGGRLFALYRAGRPYELDPVTLETLDMNTSGPFKDLGR
ncbi:hypothetical protein ACHAWF_006787, partial [Thalassiosira exigua]